MKWILEKELYAKLQEKDEDSLQFIMRKLEFKNLLSIHMIMRDKVDLILFRMLSHIQEKVEISNQ